VLAGGLSSEFEEEVIRERWKLIKKKNEVKDLPWQCPDPDGSGTLEHCNQFRIQIHFFVTKSFIL
jgi:hypothetical protein